MTDFRLVHRVQVTAEDLRPVTVYAVTVRALNRMGPGPESDPPVSLKPEAPPSSAPVN